MKKILYNLFVIIFAICVIYKLKESDEMVLLVISLLIIVWSILILLQIIFLKDFYQFEKKISRLKFCLWGFGEESEIPNLKDELNKIIDDKEGEINESNYNYRKSQREVRKKFGL